MANSPALPGTPGIPGILANPLPTPSVPSAPHVVINRIPAENIAMTASGNQLLDGSNWSDWEVEMDLLTGYCDVDGYVKGNIKHPDPQTNPITAANWDHNDRYAMMILRRNVNANILVHINQCKTAYEAWQTLQAVFETRNEGVAMSYAKMLYELRAREGDNIDEHITLLKKYLDCVNSMHDENFYINDTLFKGVITSLLPQSWEAFLMPYIGMCTAYNKQDPKNAYKT